MSGKNIDERFIFLKDGEVHIGLIQDVRVVNNLSATRYRLLFSPASSADEFDQSRDCDISSGCKSSKYIVESDAPIYVMNALRENEFRDSTVAIGTHNYQQFMPVSMLASSEADKKLATHLHAFFSEDAEPPIDINSIAYSTGFARELVAKRMSVLVAQGILKMAYEDDEWNIVDGKLQELNVMAGLPGSSLREHSKYFSPYDLPKDVIKPFIFFLMPFKEGECPQDFYSDDVKTHIKQLFNVNCYRADDDKFTRNGMSKIRQYICESKIVIAELSFLNPNVMYELGIAHALEKESIIFTRDPSKLPFDLRHLTVVCYSMDTLLGDLDKALTAHF
ncbi:MAG: hypothetical protein ABIK83_00930 [Candidatus Zixiibacteriota bacterium]